MFDLDSLEPLFRPRSVAVVGASAEPTRIGGRVIQGNLAAGYSGRLFPVNPSHEEMHGLRCYRSIAAIGEQIDLAIIAVPAARAEDALKQCAIAGVRAAIVFSSGFAELGEEGAARQQRLAAIAETHGIRLMGPNCMGVLNMPAGLVASFGRAAKIDSPLGSISVIAQSGAFGAHCTALMREHGLRLDLWAATGNQADIDVADCIAFAAQRGEASVIIGCIEGVDDGARLMAALRRARENRVPVVMMKLGGSQVGGAAVATHTASLAGSDAVFDAAMRACDAYRARTVDELLDVAYACTARKFPRRRSIGLITTSGGFGAIMADAAAEHGLAVPALPDPVQADLRAVVPFAATRNPVDVTGQYLNDEGIIRPMLRGLLAGGSHEAAICYIGSPSTLPRLVPIFAAVAAEFPDRLLAVAIIADAGIRRQFETAGYLVYADPARAVAAIAALQGFAAAWETQRPAATAHLRPAIAAPGPPGELLGEMPALQILQSAGLPVLPFRLAQSAEAAAHAAGAFGVPVVLKIASPDIAHKSEVGGVVLNVAGPAAAARGYRELLARVQQAAPAARIDGVLVTPLVEDAVEIIVGARVDPAFGPILLVGLGGVYVEVLRDTVLRLAPVDQAQAIEMINALAGAAILLGARNREASDIAALANAMVTLSEFVAANSAWLESVEINPLLVRTAGNGAVAADALIQVAAATARSHRTAAHIAASRKRHSRRGCRSDAGGAA